MKFIALFSVLFLSAVMTASADRYLISWDANPNPVDGYRIYRAVNPPELPEQLAEVSDLSAEIEVPPFTTIFLTAFRGPEESDPSPPVLVYLRVAPPAPLPPLNRPSAPRVSVAVSVSVSPTEEP